MQFVAITFFCIATLAGVALMPNSMSLVPLLLASVARAIALLLALVFWVWSGRLDTWHSSRLMLTLWMILGAAALTVGCLFIQMTRDDNVPAPAAMVYRVTAALLPLCFMAAVLLPSRKMYLIVSILAPIAGVITISTWDSLHARFVANQPKSKEQRECDEALARRTADLARVPETAGPEALVDFVNPAEIYDVRTKALARIEKTPDWIPRLAALLEGENRLKAVYVLSRRVSSLPNDVLERCWNVTESIAKDQTELLKKGTPTAESDQEMLHDCVMGLGDAKPTRQQHWKEIAAVHEFFVAANSPVNTAIVDSWARQTSLRQIPEDAGIVPLLAYVGLDAYDVRQEAMARIAKFPDSTAKLSALLDDPHRLGALVVLADRVDTLPEDLLERCWQATVLTASEMSRSIAQGKPPTRTEVRKLNLPARVFWFKLSADQQKSRLADLASIMDVVQVAGGEVEKADFYWANPFLASARPAQPAAR